MAAAAPSLNGGPPLPPNLQPAPQATLGGLAGSQPQQNPEQPGGSASLQQAVIQKLMFIEATLNDIGTMMPAAAPVASGLINQLRKGMGAILAQGATPPAASGPPTGSMLMAGGGAGQAPSS
jgi:hypothetical protein